MARGLHLGEGLVQALSSDCFCLDDLDDVSRHAGAWAHQPVSGDSGLGTQTAGNPTVRKSVSAIPFPALTGSESWQLWFLNTPSSACWLHFLEEGTEDLRAGNTCQEEL